MGNAFFVALIAASAWLAFSLSSETTLIPTAARNMLYKQGDIGHEAFFRDLAINSVPCEINASVINAPKYKDFVRCRQRRFGPVELLVVGDSHAEHLFPGLLYTMPETNVDYIINSGDIHQKWFEPVLNHIKNNPGIRTVIISDMHMPLAQAKTVLEQLFDTSKEIVLVSDVPAFPFEASACKFGRLDTKNDDCSVGRNAVPKTIFRQQKAFERYSREFANVTFVNGGDVFCDLDSCHMAGGGQIFYRDKYHLNLLGSRRLARHIANSL